MNSSTSTKLHRGMADRTETNAETRMLCVITLACYSTALAAIFILGYSLLALALSAAEQHLINIYSRLGL